jgi:nicotinamidase/pyrazinamidase
MKHRSKCAPSSTALLVIDMQNDFIDGALAVPDAAAVIDTINQLATNYEHVVLTQDWHPKDHFSFANEAQGKMAFSNFEADYGVQTVWPTHCVQGTHGAALSDALSIDHARLILRKGMRPHVDSYSAFLEADGVGTGLAEYLRALGITHVHVVGLATDFCVAYTAMDAARLGFEVSVLAFACRAIDLNGSLALARERMIAANNHIIDTPF